jgi:hypothetical protein
MGNLKELIRVHRFGTESLRQGRFSPRGRERVGAPCCPHPLCPPLPRGGRGGLWSAEAKLPPTLKLTLQRSKQVSAQLPSPTLWELKGVGFFLRACLLAALPSRAFLPPCERDARAPSTRDAGNAGVPPAMPTAREKTYPFKRCGRGAGGEGRKWAHFAHSEPKRCTLIRPEGGGRQLPFFVNFSLAIGIIPIAWSEFTNRVYSCLPYTQEDYLCADENS